MRYQGGKARIAKDIAPRINQLIALNKIDTYIEPFVGGANMIQHIDCRFKIGADINKYLIAFWQEIQKGWNPLDEGFLSREQYKDIRENKENYPPHIVALAGICGSYRGTWFGGYAGITPTKQGTYRNYYDEAVRNVLKQAPQILDVLFECKDYREINVRNALIYCDPPYQGKTGYLTDFDHDEYWQWVREQSKYNIVLCSEYNAPPDFKCIWQKEITTQLATTDRSKAVEKLFIWEGN